MEGEQVAVLPEVAAEHGAMAVRVEHGADRPAGEVVPGQFLDAADPYFNSGVLLIDRNALAAADLPGRIAGMKTQGLLDQLYFDQDILNYVFAGNWRELDWRFNLMIPRKPHEGLNPAILHYTGYRHPWEIWSGVAFSRTYRHVMTNKVFWQFWRERQKRRFMGRA
jgi:lipopolysaccharide biosynthesis glycosyltransferase